MGACLRKPVTDTEAAAKDAAIKRMLEEDAARKKPVKLLLLGTGESGKSTIFKQLQLLSGKPFTDEEKMESIEIVYKNIMENFIVLLNQVNTEVGESVNFSEEDKAHMEEFLTKYNKETALTPAIAEEVKSIWNKASVQHLWSIRANFQIMDSLGYYLTEIDRIADPEYMPNQLDILSVRVRSSGILTHVFQVDGREFSVLDVGGQRNERKKWIHCFDGVTGIIFVVAINEYDQVLFEDKNTSRVAEAITVFKALLKNSLFINTPIILLLNKNDIFEKKIVESPFSTIDGVDERFEGPYTDTEGIIKEDAINAAKEWMKNLFLKCNTNPDRKIYTYYTTALDNNSVSQFFEATKEILSKVE